MISHKHKCIFIHVPKCAGTSIEKALGHYELYDGRDRQDHRSLREIEMPFTFKNFEINKNNFFELSKRVVRQYLSNPNPRNKIRLTDEQFSQYFKFTIVRNPWDRAYSWYKNVTKDEVQKKRLKIKDGESFEDALLKNIGKDMLRPQTYWIKKFDGTIELDFIARFENINDDFQTISRLLNLKGVSLPHELKSFGSSYKDQYNEKTKTLIADFYSEEIRIFNYKF